MDRAYSILTVKSVDEDKREIRGIATTPTPDRMGDIVEPLGVKFANPMPLLWQHHHDKPVGHAVFAEPTSKGIEFTASMPTITEPGVLKDRIDEAWQSLKAKLVRGVSIGFRAIEMAYIKDTGGLHFLKSEVLELSLVTVPANADASITSIKSLDNQLRAAAFAAPDIPATTAPAATGQTVRVVRLSGAARGGAPFVIREIKRTPR